MVNAAFLVAYLLSFLVQLDGHVYTKNNKGDASILEQQAPAETHRSYGNWNEMSFYKWAVDSLALLSPRIKYGMLTEWQMLT